METEIIDKVFLELSQVTTAKTAKEIELLDAVQIAYRKHHMGDDSISYEELSDILHSALFNVMGAEELERWRKNVTL